MASLSGAAKKALRVALADKNAGDQFVSLFGVANYGTSTASALVVMDSSNNLALGGTLTVAGAVVLNDNVLIGDSAGKVGFFGTAVTSQSSPAITTAEIHAELVTLGLFGA